MKPPGLSGPGGFFSSAAAPDPGPKGPFNQKCHRQSHSEPAWTGRLRPGAKRLRVAAFRCYDENARTVIGFSYDDSSCVMPASPKAPAANAAGAFLVPGPPACCMHACMPPSCCAMMEIADNGSVCRMIFALVCANHLAKAPHRICGGGPSSSVFPSDRAMLKTAVFQSWVFLAPSHAAGPFPCRLVCWCPPSRIGRGERRLRRRFPATGPSAAVAADGPVFGAHGL